MNAKASTSLPNRDLFSRCWRALGARDDSALGVLQCRYTEGHRAYHTAEHIEECLAWWVRLAPLATAPNELATAIYFHDAVYDPTAADNEARSSALFAGCARRAGIGEEIILRIEQLIMMTRSHTATVGDAALLSDIDLAVLGASPARYARYEAAVRSEYAAFDDATYRAGRTRVLVALLERFAIYRTEPTASLLERAARNNLSRELWALRDARRTTCSSC